MRLLQISICRKVRLLCLFRLCTTEKKFSKRIKPQLKTVTVSSHSETRCSFNSIIVQASKNIGKAQKSSGFWAFCCLVVFIHELVNYAVFEGYRPDFAVFNTKVGAYRVYKILQYSRVCLLQKPPVIDEPFVRELLTHDEVACLVVGVNEQEVALLFYPALEFSSFCFPCNTNVFSSGVRYVSRTLQIMIKVCYNIRDNNERRFCDEPNQTESRDGI